jgi:hypothetical protein
MEQIVGITIPIHGPVRICVRVGGKTVSTFHGNVSAVHLQGTAERWLELPGRVTTVVGITGLRVRNRANKLVLSLTMTGGTVTVEKGTR